MTTIRQRRKAIHELASAIDRELDEIEEHVGSKKPFALSEEEFSWIGKARDYIHSLAEIDINVKPD